MTVTRLILTCEHAVNTVPPTYLPLFKQAMPVLDTHRGIDIGAAAIASKISQTLGCFLTCATITRLLIDCNRSVKGQCFSEFSKTLSPLEKKQLIHDHYTPFRKRVYDEITRSLNCGERVLHLSIHSFTPVLNGVTRQTDIGLLYDPKRPSERAIAQAWRRQLTPHYRVRMNYPYRGTSDGHTTALRQLFHDDCYSGLELECNQALSGVTRSLQILSQIITDSVVRLMSS